MLSLGDRKKQRQTELKYRNWDGYRIYPKGHVKYG